MPSDMKAAIRVYASPTAVLLALDWEEDKNYPDFLGFAIRRSPGYAAGHREASFPVSSSTESTDENPGAGCIATTALSETIGAFHSGAG